jgi:uncharacterized NAD(P)/FAD-binding protein YdhS
MEKQTASITIVGMGFCGMMTAVHLIKNAEEHFTLNIVNKGYPDCKGPAYSTDNPHLILNVPTGKMSCVSTQPDHFLNWISNKEPFKSLGKDLLAITFMSRKLYGEYLSEVWKETIDNSKGLVEVNIIKDTATGVEETDDGYVMSFENTEPIRTDIIVLATGNEAPGTPEIPNKEFFKSKEYFPNPWSSEAVKNLENESNILIIGNGLTMVDTVIGLMDNGFHGKIYSISPNGLAMLQHRHGGVVYKNLIEELKEPYDLKTLFGLFKKHVKFVRQFGISAEPVVDSIRGKSQSIWMSLSNDDKEKFMKNLRHLWGVARHRVPGHIYDKILRLKLDGKLTIIKGRLKDINKTEEGLRVDYRNKKTMTNESLIVSRVINCTGPFTDISKSGNPLIASMVNGGLIKPDYMKLGIDADITFRVIGKDNEPSKSIYTLGGNLKGLLWESTAVPELRVQAENLASALLQKVNELETEPVE